MYQSNLLISFHHQNAYVHRFSCPQVPIVIQIYQYISSQPFHFSAWFAFLLPCYSTFKVLSHQPVSEPDIQKWAMYWSVVGAFVAFEYLAEWLISWQVTFPPLAPCDHYHYSLLGCPWELKTAFLLFLSLPQTGPRAIRPKVGSQKTRFGGFCLSQISKFLSGKDLTYAQFLRFRPDLDQTSIGQNSFIFWHAQGLEAARDGIESSTSRFP